MLGQRLVFVERNRVELEAFEVPEPKAGEVQFRNLATLASAGTEVAKFVGLQEIAFPWVPGYASAGEVTVCGAGVTNLSPGDLVFSNAEHASHGCTRVLHAKLPAGLAPETAVFARLASVALTGLRVSDVELGDRVAVIGLGVVGNLCAQLFQLAGADVIGLELSAVRRERALACGLRNVVDAAGDGGVAAVKELTDGRGVNATIECVGYPPLVDVAAAITAKRGEVIWVGSPRGEWITDATHVLNHVHLWGEGCLTFKGAHEWRIPTRPADGLKHSLQSHAEFLLRLLSDGRLVTDPLKTHVISPADAQAAYEGLRDEKDKFLGVVFDWRRL